MTHPQYHPVHIEKLSPAVIAKMLNGHRVRIKHGNHHVIHLSHEQHKKHVSAHKKGAGHIIQFDPFQQQMEVHQKLRHGHSHPHTHGYGRQLTESSSFHAHHGWGEGVCGEGGRGKKGARRGRGPFDIFKSVVKAVARSYLLARVMFCVRFTYCTGISGAKPSRANVSSPNTSEAPSCLAARSQSPRPQPKSTID